MSLSTAALSHQGSASAGKFHDGVTSDTVKEIPCTYTLENGPSSNYCNKIRKPDTYKTRVSHFVLSRGSSLLRSFFEINFKYMFSFSLCFSEEILKF